MSEQEARKSKEGVAESFAAIGRFALAWRDGFAARMVTFTREVNARTSDGDRKP